MAKPAVLMALPDLIKKWTTDDFLGSKCCHTVVTDPGISQNSARFKFTNLNKTKTG